MTKTIRDNITGAEVDADDAVELTMIDRSEGKLVKVEFDMSRSGWLEFYKAMIKKAPYQRWIRHDDEEKENTGKTGHWSKMQ